jgi:DNA polymerase-3 subunit epsilon
MNLHLDRNLIFFDIESTGLNVIRDRIIQLAMIRYHQDGSPAIEKTYLINPAFPYPRMLWLCMESRLRM